MALMELMLKTCLQHVRYKIESDDYISMLLWYIIPLAMIDGRAFLLITPSGAKGLFKSNKGHDGTYFIPFQNISSAKLLRDSKGALKIHKYVKTFDRNHGMSDFDSGASGGSLVQGWVNLKDPKGEYFQLWKEK